MLQAIEALKANVLEGGTAQFVYLTGGNNARANSVVPVRDGPFRTMTFLRGCMGFITEANHSVAAGQTGNL